MRKRTIELTKQQEKIYNIIKEFINKNGYAPTIREIGEIAGLNSPATTFTHLKYLVNKEYITMVEGKPRTMRVLK